MSEQTPRFEDKEIICAEENCGPFIWGSRDQEFYDKMGFKAPRRCPLHAKARRKAYNERNEKVASAEGSREEGQE